MRVLKLNEVSERVLIAQVTEILEDGGIVVLPTDTVYGIVGDARNERAIKKIFTIKKRAPEKALPIFVKDITQARQLAYISDNKVRFLEKVWPGSVTVILHHKEKLPQILTGGFDTIGIRMPDSSFLLRLVGRLNAPLVQSSANVSLKPPAKNVEEIRDYFGGSKTEPDLVIDGGKIDGQPSTVVDFTGKYPIVRRAGIVTKQGLDRILSKF